MRRTHGPTHSIITCFPLAYKGLNVIFLEQHVQRLPQQYGLADALPPEFTSKGSAKVQWNKGRREERA